MTIDGVPASPAAVEPRFRVGVLGAGMIATIGYGYLPHLGKVRDRIEVAAIANRGIEKARAVAEAHGIPRAVATLDELLALDIDAVVNLLPGPDHFAASRRILESGRHLVTEKPITNSLAEADELLDIADRRGLYVVAAPADMLASECRLASYLAIARGDVPQEHWFRLGRQLTRTTGGFALSAPVSSVFGASSRARAPLWSSIIFFTIARPSPVPFTRFVT